jgi:hypothetical protein
VHDTRNISSTLSTQEFTSEQPVTALCWQHMPNKQHKRNSLGATSAAAHTTAGSSDSAAQSSQSHAVASGAKGLTTAAAAPGARSSAGDSGDGAAAQLPQKTPLVVYGREGATPQTALTSSERVRACARIRVIVGVGEGCFAVVDSCTASADSSRSAGRESVDCFVDRHACSQYGSCWLTDKGCMCVLWVGWLCGQLLLLRSLVVYGNYCLVVRQLNSKPV